MPIRKANHIGKEHTGLVIAIGDQAVACFQPLGDFIRQGVAQPVIKFALDFITLADEIFQYGGFEREHAEYLIPYMISGA